MPGGWNWELGAGETGRGGVGNGGNTDTIFEVVPENGAGAAIHAFEYHLNIK